MILDVNELENNSTLEISIDEQFDELDAHAVGMLTAKMSGNFVFIRGNIEVKIILECSRCLKKFEDVLNVNIDEKFFKGAKNLAKSKEHQMKASDFEEELGECEEIDLRDLIYQSIIINVPSQILCDENCEGIKELKQYIKADENIQTIEIPLKVSKNNNK